MCARGLSQCPPPTREHQGAVFGSSKDLDRTDKTRFPADISLSLFLCLDTTIAHTEGKQIHVLMCVSYLARVFPIL